MSLKLNILIIISFLSILSLKCDKIDDGWNSFKRRHGKSYRSGEERIRKNVWKKNMQLINEHNGQVGNDSFRMEINENADLTWEEFREYKLGFLPLNESLMGGITENVHYDSSLENVPAFIDWRQRGIVMPIRDQGSCGSCWSFAAVSALESQILRRTGRSAALSEQQLVDCAGTQFGNSGCNGGWMKNAYDYIRRNGITSNTTYPYQDMSSQCVYNQRQRVATLSGYTTIPQGNERALTNALAQIGPIAIAVDVTSKFQFYKSGIFDDDTCSNKSSDVKHAVVAVGYGTSPRGDFYIVRNSWGTTWGENGYIRMIRNRNNQCGIANFGIYPNL